MARQLDQAGGPPRGVLKSKVSDFRWTVQTDLGVRELTVVTEDAVQAGGSVYLVPVVGPRLVAIPEAVFAGQFEAFRCRMT